MRVIPVLHVETGEREADVAARWVIFATDYPPGTPPEQVRECPRSMANPLHFARAQHRDGGQVTGTTMHPNLLCPVVLDRARRGELFLTRPALIRNETGDNA